MNRDQVYAAILRLVEQKGDEWDEPGDVWLFRPNPDEASLLTGALAGDLADLFMDLHKASFA